MICHYNLFVFQILVTFSQISSRYPSIFKQRKQNGRNNSLKENEASSAYDAIICNESLVESLKNFDKNVLMDMKRVDIRSLGPVIGPHGQLRNVPTLNSVKKVSYISENSFELNKNGVYWNSRQPSFTIDCRSGKPDFKITDNFISALTRNVLRNNFTYNIQVRGFKTERSVVADLKRNPNLVNRLRKFLGQY